MSYPVLTLATAPEASRPLLEDAQRSFGFIPNLLGVLAHSPAALGAYLGVGQALGQARLTAAEQQIVAIAVSAENACPYCVAAHSLIAGSAKAPSQAIAAARAQGLIADPRLEALRGFATAVVATRGRPGDEDVRRFLAAGFDRGQLLDVLAVVAMKTLSNYTNHLADTPLDAAFASHRWEAPAVAA